nr:MAG TPA: hypothetical protein [Caudoviricetes sp.]
MFDIFNFIKVAAFFGNSSYDFQGIISSLKIPLNPA